MRTFGCLLPLSRAAMLVCLLAFLAPSEQAISAQSARSIIPQLQEQFGLSETQVRHALGVQLMQGVVTGPLDDRGEYEAALSRLGMGEEIASQFAPAVLEYLAAAGDQDERNILGQVLN